MLEAAQSEAAEITQEAEERAGRITDDAKARAAETSKAAEEEAAEVLAEAGRMASEAKELERKREQALAEVLDRTTKIEGLFEELRAMLGVQQGHLKGPNPNWNEILRRRVEEMRKSGKSRADAERILKRFTIGGSYVEMLDAVYPAQEKEEERRTARTRLPWRKNR